MDDEMVPVRGTNTFQWWLKGHHILVEELEWELENIIPKRRSNEFMKVFLEAIKKRRII